MLRADFHRPTSVRAHVSSGTGFVTAIEGEATVCVYLTIEQARAVAASLTAGLAEHDLVEAAKAQARAQTEAV